MEKFKEMTSWTRSSTSGLTMLWNANFCTNSISPGRQVGNIVESFRVGLAGEGDVRLDVGRLHFHSGNHAAARIGDAAGQGCGRTCQQASGERHQEHQA